jgi:hypothetical protein
MGTARHQMKLDAAFEQIEESILPSISMMLDTLLDAASLGRPGVDAEIYAAELRTIALQLEGLTREVESLSFPPQRGSAQVASVA